MGIFCFFRHCQPQGDSQCYTRAVGTHGLPGVGWGEEQRTEVGSGLEGGVVGGGQSPAGVRSLSKKDR